MPFSTPPPWNVLVIPADSEAGIEIHGCLHASKETVLTGVSFHEESVAASLYARLHFIPDLADGARALQRLRDVVTSRSIDAVFPASLAAAAALAEARADLPCAVIAPSGTSLETCSSPTMMGERLSPHVPVARAGRDDAREAILVNCFSQDGKGVLWTHCSREIHGAGTRETADFAEAEFWASVIAERLGLRGAWSFSAARDGSGRAELLAIVPFAAEGLAFCHALGPNLPLLSLYDAAGYPLEIDSSAARFRMGYIHETLFRHDGDIEALYMDLDGSLIVHDRVNTRMLALIYQCHNRRIPVTLLTRHPGDLEMTLKKFRLGGAFDAIVHVTDISQPKADHIREKHAVLVDDSFAERRDVRRRLGIRCLDPAAALSLLDRRDG